MALILSIETATSVCSVALHENGKLIAYQRLHIAQSHAESLLLMIEHLLKLSPYDKKDLTAVAISQGPGSYTGLRIGTSTAQGLCYALGMPLIAINTLEAMAYGVSVLNGSNAFLCPMIDARRMEVYALVADFTGQVMEATQPYIIEPNSFQAWLEKGPIAFFGDGAAKCKSILGHHPHAIFLDDIHPSAQYIGDLAYEHYLQGDFVVLNQFEPLYLKPFQGKMQQRPSLQ